MNRSDVIANISRIRTDNSVATAQSMMGGWVCFRDNSFEVRSKGNRWLGFTSDPAEAADMILELDRCATPLPFCECEAESCAGHHACTGSNAGLAVYRVTFVRQTLCPNCVKAAQEAFPGEVEAL